MSPGCGESPWLGSCFPGRTTTFEIPVSRLAWGSVSGKPGGGVGCLPHARREVGGQRDPAARPASEGTGKQAGWRDRALTWRVGGSADPPPGGTLSAWAWSPDPGGCLHSSGPVLTRLGRKGWVSVGPRGPPARGSACPGWSECLQTAAGPCPPRGGLCLRAGPGRERPAAGPTCRGGRLPVQSAFPLRAKGLGLESPSFWAWTPDGGLLTGCAAAAQKAFFVDGSLFCPGLSRARPFLLASSLPLPLRPRPEGL